jgi:hypothetical protein
MVSPRLKKHANELVYLQNARSCIRKKFDPLEVMFTSAVGFGEHHFLGVNKTQCPPYEKSLIV